MRRYALLTASFSLLLAASAQAGSAPLPAMTPMPGASSAATVQQIGLRRCPLGAVQCMGGFVQRCVERWGDTMWMTSGQRCSG